MLKIKRGLWGVLVLCSFSATAQQLRSVDAPPEEVKIPVEPYALEQRYRTLAAMPSVQVRYSDLGLIDQIKGNTGIAVSRRATSLQPGDAATELLAPLKDVLLATGDEALTVTANQFIEPNTRTITTEQTIRGIPVLFGLVAFGIEESTGRVNGVTAYFLPDRGLPRKAVISADEAIQSAVEALESSERAEPHSVNVSRSPTLAYHGAVRGATSTALVWVVRASFLPLEEGPPETEEMWIDATDGTYLGGHNPSQSALNRTVYSAGNVSLNRDAYPTGLGNPLFTEGGSSSDSTAMNAYNNAGKTMLHGMHVSTASFRVRSGSSCITG